MDGQHDITMDTRVFLELASLLLAGRHSGGPGDPCPAGGPGAADREQPCHAATRGPANDRGGAAARHTQ